MLGKTLQLMTPSEFHTFLVGQHSTLSGAIIGLFIFFGVKLLLRSALFTFPEALVKDLTLEYGSTSCMYVTGTVGVIALQRLSRIAYFKLECLSRTVCCRHRPII